METVLASVTSQCLDSSPPLLDCAQLHTTGSDSFLVSKLLPNEGPRWSWGTQVSGSVPTCHLIKVTCGQMSPPSPTPIPGNPVWQWWLQWWVIGRAVHKSVSWGSMTVSPGARATGSKTPSPAARSSPCACRREACQQENPDIPSTHLDTDQKAASPGKVPIPLGYSKTIKSSLRGYPKPGLRSK